MTSRSPRPPSTSPWTPPCAAGALGARMTGGGFGGAAIALIPRHRAAALTQATRDAFTAAGFAAPQVRTVTPSPGAHRENKPA